MPDALSVARQRLFSDAVSFTGPVALSVTIHRCSILGFHSQCLLPSLWQFSACLCCDFICKQIHDAFSFAGPAAFRDVVFSYSAARSSALSRSVARLLLASTGFRLG